MAGVPKGTMRHRLLAFGIELRGRGGNHRNPPQREYVKTAFMYERLGMSTNEIAEQLGLHPSTIQNRLKQHGVEMRSKEESVRLRWERRPRRKPYGKSGGV
jgi:uncharacterized protein YjcR